MVNDLTDTLALYSAMVEAYDRHMYPPGSERHVEYAFQCAICGDDGYAWLRPSELPKRGDHLCRRCNHGNEVIIDTHGTAHVRHKRVRYSDYDDDGEWSRDLLSL